jgi:radical SAM protein with 4Fe4S-binding SPASM domain
LADFRDIGYLWISFNDHREAEYEVAMQLPYHRTIERLALIHKKKADGLLHTRVVLSRVGDGSVYDAEFIRWVKIHYPLFEVSIFPRGAWLGQVSTINPLPSPDIGCSRWFDISITATGVVAHCCMDGNAEFPLGDVRQTHLLEIYNQPSYRRLRASVNSRLDVEPCLSCNFL